MTFFKILIKQKIVSHIAFEEKQGYPCFSKTQTNHTRRCDPWLKIASERFKSNDWSSNVTFSIWYALPNIAYILNNKKM